MTSTPTHATTTRQTAATRATETESIRLAPPSLPRPSGVRGIAVALLRKPVAIDALLLFAAFLFASMQAPISSQHPALVALFATGVTIGLARKRGVYTVAATDSRLVASRRAGEALGIAAAGFLLLAYVTDFAHDRSWLLLAAGGAAGVFVLHRSAALALASHPKVLPFLTTRLALIGDASSIAEFEKLDSEDPRRVVVERTNIDTYDDVRPALRKVDRLIGMVHNGEIDRVVVLATAPGVPVVNAVVRRCSMRGVSVDILTGATGVRSSRIDVGRLSGFSTVHIRPGLHGQSRVVLKRAFDMVVASLALVALSPVMVGAAIAVKIGSSGPVFYKQRRLGRGGQQFEMIKFRSMLPEADQMLVDLTDQNEADGPLFKIKDDPRITRVGGILRRTSIDELPQLWNVVRGDMSLVGPRPALAIEADGWPIELFDRLEVPPGITGLWQVNGRSNASFADYARLDLYYVDNWTIGLDVAILARTIPALLGRGAY